MLRYGLAGAAISLTIMDVSVFLYTGNLMAVAVANVLVSVVFMIGAIYNLSRM